MNQAEKTVIASLIVAMVLSLGVAFATGNGAPSGPHYNLNLIGMSKEKGDIGCGEGRRIFVQLGEPKSKNPLPATTRIYLTEAPDDVTFDVIDCDGTDGSAAFMLPNPDPGQENCTKYSVYIRALGTPKGSAVMTTCATDPLTGEEVCSVETVQLQHTKGTSPKFVNVSKELLTMCVQICTAVDAEGNCTDVEWARVYLFDPELENYLWKYDNNGLRIAQMRFYLEPTCDLDLTCPPTPPAL